MEMIVHQHEGKDDHFEPNRAYRYSVHCVEEILPSLENTERVVTVGADVIIHFFDFGRFYLAANIARLSGMWYYKNEHRFIFVIEGVFPFLPIRKPIFYYVLIFPLCALDTGRKDFL